MERSPTKHLYLTIEGPIGVGKTTLARLLQGEFGAQLLLEVFEENPFLGKFYADREMYAFQTQIFFLLSRYRQQEVVREALCHSPLISDYAFAKDRLFAHLNLKGDELAVYESLHSALAEKVTLPDLIVFLRARTEALLERIAFRDRTYERDMDRDYIDAVNRAYDDFFASYQAVPVLPLDTNEVNYVRHKNDLDYVIGRIRAALEGIYQPPLLEVE